MAHQNPHLLALFSLLPLNGPAWNILNHPDNACLVSTVHADGDGAPSTQGLNIGFHIGSKSRYTLATIGRHQADITTEGKGFSRIQCSFEIHEKTNEIMLQDRSSNYTTQTFGETAVPFESCRIPRRVVVDKATNLKFGFGGVACDLVQFRLHWHNHKINVQGQVGLRIDNPRQARTVDEAPTDPPSYRATRIHTPGKQVKIRYSVRRQLGRGSFGEVFKIANIDNGENLALKRIEQPDLQSHNYRLLKREVELFSKVSHDNIVEFIAAQSSEGHKHLEIFMELKDGNLKELIADGLFVQNRQAVGPLTHQMLQALDYLAYNEIVHRDIKPENILYTSSSAGQYKYELTDFGLSNYTSLAKTWSGSPIYMAPELDRNRDSPQSAKMDIWSLFVTLAYALDLGGFQKKPLHTLDLRIKAVQEAAREPEFEPLRTMAIVDFQQRASAADILDKVFHGEGRTTPYDTEKPKPKVGFQYTQKPQNLAGGIGDTKKHAGEDISVPAAKRSAGEAFGAITGQYTEAHVEKTNRAKHLATSAAKKNHIPILPPTLDRHAPNPILQDFRIPGAYPSNQQQPQVGRTARR